jgi:hypothetical protein
MAQIADAPVTLGPNDRLATAERRLAGASAHATMR